MSSPRAAVQRYQKRSKSKAMKSVGVLVKPAQPPIKSGAKYALSNEG